MANFYIFFTRRDQKKDSRSLFEAFKNQTKQCYCLDKLNTLNLFAWINDPPPTVVNMSMCRESDSFMNRAYLKTWLRFQWIHVAPFVFVSWPCLFKAHSAGTTWVEQGCLGAWVVLAPVSKVSTDMSPGLSDGDQWISRTSHTTQRRSCANTYSAAL